MIGVGAEVKNFKKGDRVCANFAINHVYGDIDLSMRQSGLGGLIDGVLTEYKLLPDYVCLSYDIPPRS